MPAFNAAPYIKEAIDSILNQSFKNFNLLILNDGSTDDTESIIFSYQDSRIVYLKNDKNEGLSYSRNKLIEHANGKYLAWMDADDISFPTRLEKEYHYLEQHPEVALVSSWVSIIDSDSQLTGNSIRSYIPSKHLSPLFLFVNYIAQSAVLIRKSIFEEYAYNDKFPPVEDYQLWTQIAYKYPLHILSEVLVNYRVHEANASHRLNYRAKKGILLNYQEQFNKLGLNVDDEILALHYTSCFNPSAINEISTLQRLGKWYSKILRANDNRAIYRNESLAFILKDRWIKVCLNSGSNISKFAKLKIYFSSELRKLSIKNLILMLKLFF